MFHNVEILSPSHDTHTAINDDDDVCLFVCLVFNDIFGTNRLYRAITVGKYIT